MPGHRWLAPAAEKIAAFQTRLPSLASTPRWHLVCALFEFTDDTARAFASVAKTGNALWVTSARLRAVFAALGLGVALSLTAGLVGQPVRAEPPSGELTGAVTDRAGVLGARAADVQAAVDEVDAATDLRLFVVYVESFDLTDSTDWANRTATLAGLTRTDVLLAVATLDGLYGLSVDHNTPLARADINAIEAAVRAAMPPAGDVASADWTQVSLVAANVIIDRAADTGDVSPWVVAAIVGGGVVVIAGVVGWFVLVVRRRGRRTADTPAYAMQGSGSPLPHSADESPVPGPAADTPTPAVRGRHTAATPAVGRRTPATAGLAPATGSVHRTLRSTDGHTPRHSAAIPVTTAAASTRLAPATGSVQRTLRSTDGHTPRHSAAIPVTTPAASTHLAPATGSRHGSSNPTVGPAPAPAPVDDTPAALDAATRQADALSARVLLARQNLDAIANDYAISVLALVADNPDLADSRLAEVHTAVAAGKVALTKRRTRPLGAVQADAAQAGLAQATQLLDAVDALTADLADTRALLARAVASTTANLADADRYLLPGASVAAAKSEARAALVAAETTPGDPFAALSRLAHAEADLDRDLAPARADAENNARAAALLRDTVRRVEAQIQATAAFVETRNSAGRPLDLLDEAGHFIAEAHRLASTDPHTALTNAHHAERATADASRLALDAALDSTLEGASDGTPAGALDSPPEGDS